MGVIDQIFNQGDDFLGYEYQMSLGPIPYLDAVTNSLVRCTTVEIPEKAIGTYEYDYKSEKIVKPNGKNTSPKEFSVEFRLDKYLLLYKAFRAWSDSIVSPITGGSSIDSVNGVSSIRIPITITTGTYDVNGNFVPTLHAWFFTGCFPVSVGALNLDNQSGEPVMCSLRLSFLKMV